MILKFTGQLSQIMGEEARLRSWEDAIGLKYTQGHQSMSGEVPVTLMEVVDTEKAQKYLNHPSVEILTEDDADLILTEKMDKVTYKKYDDALYGANIQKKIQDGTLDIDAMRPEWTDQKELEYLYNLGISGIKRHEHKTKKFKEMK
jgi:hypothetical protein